MSINDNNNHVVNTVNLEESMEFDNDDQSSEQTGEEKKEDDDDVMAYNWNSTKSMMLVKEGKQHVVRHGGEDDDDKVLVHHDRDSNNIIKHHENICTKPFAATAVVVQNGHKHPPQLPMEVMYEICHWISDPVSLCRLAMTCRSFHQCVDHVAPIMWKYFYQHRWTRSVHTIPTIITMTTTTTPTTNSNGHDNDHPTTTAAATTSSTIVVINWKELYQQRHVQDQAILDLVEKVVCTELAPQKYNFAHLHQRPGMLASTQVEDITWKQTLAKAGLNIMDVLCAIANHDTTFHPGMMTTMMIPQKLNDNNNNSSSDPFQLQHYKLRRFLAASIVFTLHCHEVVTHVSAIWEQLVLIRNSAPRLVHPPHPQQQQQLGQPSSLSLSSSNSFLLSTCYEDMVILLAHALRPVPELLQRSSSIAQLQSLVSTQMDALATEVRRRMDHPNDDHYFDGGAGILLSQHHQHHHQQQQHYGSLPSGCLLLVAIHQVLWSLPTTSSCNGFWDNSGGFGLRCHYPETRDEAIASCSIQRVLTLTSHNNVTSAKVPTKSPVHVDNQHNHIRWCHPVLVAILYQAVARRLNLELDVLFCPRHCYPMLRYHDVASRTVWFLDIMDGTILSLRECQDLVERLDLTCEDHQLPNNNNNNNNNNNPILPRHIIDHDNVGMAHNTFWGQAPMEVTSVLYWLVAPLLLNRRSRGRRRNSNYLTDNNNPVASNSSNNNNNIRQHQNVNNTHGGGDDDDTDENDDDDSSLEDQPHDFLLGQLVEGNGGSLMKFLNERLVFFTAILRFSQLIDE